MVVGLAPTAGVVVIRPLCAKSLIIATAFRYHYFVPTDNGNGGDYIKGDVVAEAIRRTSGKPGSDDGLIEIPLFGHRYRYQVRVELVPRRPPRLVELRMIASDDDTDVDPTSVRDIPVRRLAKAAARFISLTEHGIGVAGDEYDPTGLRRPDMEPMGRRKLDDAHYRQVAKLLMWAREIGESPREYVSAELNTPLPTVDRWIAKAKKLNMLRRDWATTTDQQPPTTTETDR